MLTPFQIGCMTFLFVSTAVLLAVAMKEVRKLSHGSDKRFVLMSLTCLFSMILTNVFTILGLAVEPNKDANISYFNFISALFSYIGTAAGIFAVIQRFLLFQEIFQVRNWIMRTLKWVTVILWAGSTIMFFLYFFGRVERIVQSVAVVLLLVFGSVNNLILSLKMLMLMLGKFLSDTALMKQHDEAVRTERRKLRRNVKAAFVGLFLSDIGGMVVYVVGSKVAPGDIGWISLARSYIGTHLPN